MTGTRSALIVANSDYADAELRQLRAPASDAEELGAVLRDPDIGGFDVRTLLNEPAHDVNLAVEEFFADRQPDDLLLMHFSCHGVKDADGELYFAVANTVLRTLAATAVSAGFVNGRMSRTRSRRVVLLLDCCYAGAFDRGMTARAGTGVGVEAQFAGRGRAVITASSAMEYAFEGAQLADTLNPAPSVFTSALVEGLATGDADRDQDGLIALDELYDYVYDKVREATPNQTPGKWAFGVQGELIIARRSRPVTAPARLPDELMDALVSPFASIRGGAVQELAVMLTGRHAGLALAARQALERMTSDDSRTVAAAATSALADAPPAPAGPPPSAWPPPGPVTEAPAAEAPAADAAPALDEPAQPVQPVATPAESKAAEPALAAAATSAPAAPPTAAPSAHATHIPSATQPPADGPAAATPGRPGTAIFLPAGFVFLALAMGVIASAAMTPSNASWPWALIIGACVAGIAVTLGGIRRSVIAATAVLVSLTWLMVYSVSVLGLQPDSTPFGTAHTVLTAEGVIGAVLSAGLCAWAIAAALRGSRGVVPVLAVVNAGLATAWTLAAIAVHQSTPTTSPQPVWDALAWICVVVVLLSLVAATVVWRSAAART